MKQLHLIWNRIKTDLWQNRAAILIIALYFLLTGLLFGQVCPSKLLCGLPCPGCGLVRGCLAFLTLQFSTSFHYNITAPLWIAGILYLIICRYVLGRRCSAGLPLFIVICCTTMATYIWRMWNQFPGEGAMCYYANNLLCFLLKL